MSWERFCQSALNQHSYQVNQLMSWLQVSYVKLFLTLAILTLYMASPDEIVCQSAQSYSTSVGIAVGVTTLIAFATGVVITAMFLLCWLRYVRW